MRSLAILAGVLTLWLGVAARADDGLQVWAQIYEIFTHVRCTNCHVGSDGVPLWAGPSYGGAPRPHGMNINGGVSRSGEEYVPCNACHTASNSDLPHGAPGASVWALAPVEAQFLGRTAAELCEQIKNPELTGGRSIDEVADHIDHDPLVAWAWDPGADRETPPQSKDDLVILLWDWDELGAPCPSE